MLKLKDKTDYVIDGEMIDWHLDHEFKLEDNTIEPELEYSKREWLKPCIEFNIKKIMKLKPEVINLVMCSLK